LLFLSQERLKLALAGLKEGPQLCSMSKRDSARMRGPLARGESPDQGLGQVIRGVSRQNDGTLRGQLSIDLLTRLSSLGLHRLTRAGRLLESLDATGHTEPERKLANKALVGVRSLPSPAVVDMKELERAAIGDFATVLCQQERQRERITPPRAGDYHSGALGAGLGLCAFERRVRRATAADGIAAAEDLRS
jgi:hypothetical protein